MTTVRSDVTQLGAMEMVEMFVFDATAIGGGVLRWHPGTTIASGAVIWQGQTYNPIPIMVDGFEITATGKLPRPTLTAANIGGVLGNYLRSIGDGLKAKVIRKRTLGKYLDAANFPGGNPYANPATAFPDETFYVARKVNENPIFVEIELAVKFDVHGVMLPRRQVIAGICQWAYRSAECSYAGPPVEDINGNPTTDPNLDRCRKTLDACKARFGKGVLRTSAFPASLLVRQ
ncbi:phage minor tail protein L [Sinorhizobium meliloti]|uniref:phage minor tail protein L n=1 Tax=Rhizobium meliloti TaxID=382 RepID=UPI000FD8D069|nr:phage minor tail protein L [Sinorhizobium meliloti]MDE3825059.1 phage minor tail protein L [Sinorhizobium meliloti]RVM38169.1 phage minor tail protein L [Sinorhizobium meliloti]RVN59662.1 phage minor tail protein L [Sinorhizobium meliloti]